MASRVAKIIYRKQNENDKEEQESVSVAGVAEVKEQENFTSEKLVGNYSVLKKEINEFNSLDEVIANVFGEDEEPKADVSKVEEQEDKGSTEDVKKEPCIEDLIKF